MWYSDSGNGGWMRLAGLVMAVLISTMVVGCHADEKSRGATARSSDVARSGGSDEEQIRRTVELSIEALREGDDELFNAVQCEDERSEGAESGGLGDVFSGLRFADVHVISIDGDTASVEVKILL